MPTLPSLRLHAAATLFLSLGLLANSCTPPPWNQQLLQNPGFESPTLAPWQVEYGSCAVAREPFADADPHSGNALLHGGWEGLVASCRAWQDVDASAFSFAIDFSGASVEASAWLRSWLDVNRFDDQVLLRVRYLDRDGRELSSLRTLVVGDDQWQLRAATGLVPAGTVRLRAEIEARFRNGADNDGMADDTSLVLRQAVPAAPAITKPPMLQDVRRDAMTLLWETSSNLTYHRVEWGPAGGVLGNVVDVIETTQVDATHFVHKATIAGLSTETEYDYRVVSGTAASPVHRFRTAPAPASPFRVAWLADNQNGPGVFAAHVGHLAQRDPDLVMVPGDVVQGTTSGGVLGGSILSEWQSQWWNPLATSNLAQTTPIMIARGNHDGEHPYSYAYTALPHNESWYAFTYGNTYFVVLDSETPTGNQSVEQDQLAFLQQALASPEAQAAEFRIVVFHRPPWTRLWDFSAIFTGYDGETWIRNDWVPVFEAYAVDMVVTGHSHSYQRGERNGVHYLIVGGGGGALDTFNRSPGGGWPTFHVVQSVYHYNVMEVSGAILTWTAYDLDDQVVDTFSIFH